MIFRGILVAVVVACTAVTGVTDLQAQIVTFGPATDIGVNPPALADDQSFVNTLGADVLAVNLTDISETGTDQNVTVNGVFFTEIGEVDSANTQTFTQNGVTVAISGDGTFRDDANSFGGVPGVLGFGFDVTELLNSGFIEVDDITFTGLTPGDDYLVQFIVHDNRNNNQDDIVTFTSGGVTGTVDVINDGTNGTGTNDLGLAIGEFINATFEADADGSVSFSVDGTDDVVTALQIRNITPPAVPEPSSLALLGGLGLFIARRRRA